MGDGLSGHKIFFIVNRQAGGGKAALWWQKILPQLACGGLDFFWQYSAGGSGTSMQVREAVLKDNATAVMAVGGDGHIHDVLNGLLEDDALIKPDLVLGVYPAGSGCDFARMIYINGGDTSDSGFMALLTGGEVRRVDVGRADFSDCAGAARRAYFLNGSDIGLGAETCVRVNAEGGRFKRLVKNGQAAFLLAALQALLSFDYVPVAVEADGERLNGPYLIAGVGNGRFMGGKMCLFPQARFDDGLLDLFLVPRLPKLKILRLFAKVYDGTVLQVPEISYRQVKSVTITPERPVPLELDGELPGQAPFCARVLPSVLPLLCFDRKNVLDK